MTYQYSRPRRKWIAQEISRLDPVEDSMQIMLLSTTRMLPRFGRAMVFNLLYCLGFLRVSGQLEGAHAVDRDGAGKVHRDGERRAEDTIAHFTTWIQHGPTSDRAVASLKRVRSMHDHYARTYSISNETLVHTIALFTLQFEHLLELVNVDGFSQIEKEAQVTHWRLIGEQLGARDIPETWEEMERFLEWYESSPAWFGPTDEAHRCAESLIRQFSERRLPRGLRWIGRPLALSLVEDHVLSAVGEDRPSRPVVWLVRKLLRTRLLVERRLLPEPREPVDLSALLHSRP